MTHREEALAALERVEAMLTAPTLTDLDRRVCLAALEYAAVEVGKIQELKRARRKPKGEA